MATLTNKQKGAIKLMLDQIITNAKIAKLDVETAYDVVFACHISASRIMVLIAGTDGGAANEPELPIPDIDKPGKKAV